MRMGNHGGLNLQGQDESVAALARGDQRFAPGAHRFKERPDFEAQGLARRNFRLEEG